MNEEIKTDPNKKEKHTPKNKWKKKLVYGGIAIPLVVAIIQGVVTFISSNGKRTTVTNINSGNSTINTSINNPVTAINQITQKKDNTRASIGNSNVSVAVLTEDKNKSINPEIFDVKGMTNETSGETAILILNEENRIHSSISSAIAGIYKAAGHTTTTSLFTNKFIQSGYLNELSNGNTRILKKLELNPTVKFLVIGRYHNKFDKGELTKVISRSRLDVSVISMDTKIQSDAFKIVVSNGFDDEDHAEAGSIEKLIDKYKAEHSKLN